LVIVAAKKPAEATGEVQNVTQDAVQDAARLQLAADAIAELWSDLEGELRQASDQYVARSEKLDRLLVERDELRDQSPALERDVEKLPEQATIANLRGDAGAENQVRQRFNESSGRLAWIHDLLQDIERELWALGYSTTDPNEERAAREASVKLQRDRDQQRRDAGDVVGYQCEILVALVEERRDAALLRDSAASAANAERSRKEMVAAARTSRSGKVYGERARRTLEDVERMPQDRDLPEDREPEMPGYLNTYGP
jgi:hypothetical protein